MNPSRFLAGRIGRRPLRGLAGIVLFHQGANPGVDVAEGLAGIHPGYGQMGVPLDVLPVRFQLVLVPQFVKEVLQGLSVKHRLC